MRFDIDISHLNLSPEDQRSLLYGMIHNTERWFLQTMLRKMDIPGRTKIYNLFGWGGGSVYNTAPDTWEEQRHQRSENQMEAIDQILSQTEFTDWAKPFISDYTIGKFLGLCTDRKVNLRGFDIRVVEVPNEA